MSWVGHCVYGGGVCVDVDKTSEYTINVEDCPCMFHHVKVRIVMVCAGYPSEAPS